MKNPVQIKVCGMKKPEQISQLEELPLHWIGFIFYEKSSRYVGDDFTYTSGSNVLKKTGVFVDAPIHWLMQKIAQVPLDAVQLHGNETTAYCSAIKERGTTVIKAFAVDEQFDFNNIEPYIEFTDYFLFDTKTKLKGGSGKKFDWTVLKNYHLNHPFFLSGGIAPEDAEFIKQLKLNNLFAIDINSKFEISPAIKDLDKIKEFIEDIKD